MIETKMAETASAGASTAVPADGHTHEAACLNCGTPLLGSHCHACGQAAHVHRTLGAFFHDLLHGVFHFEGRIWRTLPMLAWRPGDLTRRYIAGQRARFVSPLALFLFTVFVMFAVIKQTAGEFDGDAPINVRGNVSAGMDVTERELARLRQERAALIRAGKDTASVDAAIGKDEQALTIMKSVNNPSGAGINIDVPALDHIVRKFEKNPGLAMYKVQSYAYKYSWLLVPISVPFLWLLFPFSRRFHLYDHTVFITYSLSFMTLLAIAVMLGSLARLPGMGPIAVIVPPLHMYRQLKGAYSLSRWGALWRTAALSVFAFTALTLFMLFIIAETGA